MSMVNNKICLGLIWSVMVIKSVCSSLIIGACEVGRYGPNCEHQCHCLVNSLCKEGKCLGLCERGYAGEPYCNERCPSHKFGLECRSDCHCINDEECDKVNGDCPSRQCAYQYDGPACQRRLPRIPRAPSILHISCKYVVLGWEAFYYNTDDGEGPIGQYIVQVKTEEAQTWYNPVNVTDRQDGIAYYTAGFSAGLVSEAHHLFRIDVMALAHGKLINKVQAGVPSFPVLHTCKRAKSTSGQSKLSLDWVLWIVSSTIAVILKCKL